MRSGNGEFMIPWTKVQALVNPGVSIQGQGIRLSGMWMRQNLFTATAPDGAGDLFVSDRKTRIAQALPSVTVPQAPRLFR